MTMSKGKRVVFTFDERSFDSLEKMKDNGNYGSLAEAVRDSLKVSRSLQQQSEQGYSEVIVRNTKTGKVKSNDHSSAAI